MELDLRTLGFNGFHVVGPWHPHRSSGRPIVCSLEIAPYAGLHVASLRALMCFHCFHNVIRDREAAVRTCNEHVGRVVRRASLCFEMC